MEKTLIEGLEAKDVQAVLDTKNLNNYYYPTLFPLKFTPNLIWKTLFGRKGTQVMADVVSYDSRAPRKTRNTVNGAQGDIPKISIGRDKIESQINEYNQLKQYAGNDEGANAILDWIYEDVDFCYDGVNLRLEWLAMRAASTGKIELSKQNNAGVITEVAVNFLVPAENKSGVAVSWTLDNAATSKPITVLKALMKAAKAKGFVPQFALTDQDTVDAVLASAETIKMVAPFILLATQLEGTPSLDQLNTYLLANKLPQFKVIDSVLVQEIENVRTVVYPWEAGVVTLTTSLQLGNTYHGPLADESVTETVALKAKRGHILVKKFSNPEPLSESTIAMANAFPALSDPTEILMIDTRNATWTH